MVKIIAEILYSYTKPVFSTTNRSQPSKWLMVSTILNSDIKTGIEKGPRECRRHDKLTTVQGHIRRVMQV